MTEPFMVFINGRTEPEESFARLDTAREFAATYEDDSTEVMICEVGADGALYLVLEDDQRILVDADYE